MMGCEGVFSAILSTQGTANHSTQLSHVTRHDLHMSNASAMRRDCPLPLPPLLPCLKLACHIFPVLRRNSMCRLAERGMQL